MKIPTFARALLPMALVLATSGASAAENTTGPGYRIDIRLPTRAAGKPAAGDARSSAASVFREVPATVRIVGHGGLRLSRTAARIGRSNEIAIATGGKSTCVRVFAQRKDLKPVPFELAIVKRGDVDPCTGKAPTAPMLDLTADAPAPQPFTHKYWKLVCKKGNGCHWVKVICTHAPGVP